MKTKAIGRNAGLNRWGASMKRRGICIMVIVVLFAGLVLTPPQVASAATDDYRAWAQSDSRWGSIPLGSSSCTVSSHGCLVTAVTKLIIQAGLRDSEAFNVATLANWLNNNSGFTGDGSLYWGKPSAYISGFVNYGDIVAYGSYSSSGNNGLLMSYINSGYHLALQVNNGGHWIAVDEAKSIATGQIYIMDSLYGMDNADISLTSRYSTFNSVHAYKGGTTPTGESRPGKSVLNTALDKNNVTFTWASTENTTHYNLWLDKKNTAGEWERVEQIFYAESGVSRTLEEGEYRAQLLSYNSNAREPDGSDWLHTWADDVFFTIKGPNTVTYYDASGNVWKTAEGAHGSSYTLTEVYPTLSGSYFSGWAYTQGADEYDVRPAEPIELTEDISLYPVYVPHAQAISGEEVYIYNIADFTDSGYTIEAVEHTVQEKVDTSYWTGWSDYTNTEISASDTVEVKTTALYRYYYYLCPSCGAHEPFWGTSDCGASIPNTSWNSTWSTVPYSQSNYQSFSYTTAKCYTTSLGDGQLWIFSSGNLYDTAAGTIDADGAATVITTGYSSRTYVEQYDTVNKTVTAYKITAKQIAPTLSKLEITSYPDKQVYFEGETLDLTGLELTATYSDGTETYITSGYTVNDIDMSTVGMKLVEVSYKDQTVKFNVRVRAYDSPEIVVDSKTAAAGDTVAVNIALKNNPGIASMKLLVKYDDILTLTGISYNEEIGGMFQQPQTLTSPVTLNWFNGLEDSEGDWVFATLTFTVSELAAVGQEAEIFVTYNWNDVYDITETNIPFEVGYGYITVTDYIPGDINGDGSVNNKDVTRLFQYLSGWDVNVNEKALDVNGDGRENNKDLTRLFQYLSNWNVEIQ